MQYGIYQPFPNAVADIIADATERFPQESCGFIIDDEYHPKKNIAEEPNGNFKIHANAFVAAEKKGLQAIVHSHPNGFQCPTKADMDGQLRTAVTWGVVWLDGEGDVLGPAWWGDDLPIQPLIGRPFVHGVYDCYSLVRDTYRLEHDIILPEFPRGPDWWDHGEDLYAKGFEDAGFYRISESDMRPGDCFMCRFKSPVTQHAGVYLGGNQALHHLTKRLSRRDTMSSWKKYVTHWVRHKDQKPIEKWKHIK